MTQLILTSAQEAAFNAAGEALVELDLNCFLKRYGSNSNSSFSVFGYRGHDENAPIIHGGQMPTLAQAMAAFIAKLEEERAKPQLITKPAEVRKAVVGIIDEYRAGESRPFNAAQLDELADRVAALPVKE